MTYQTVARIQSKGYDVLTNTLGPVQAAGT